MSKETQSYWFSDMGLWGSNPVETVEFIGHHDDIHDAFHLVSDSQQLDWALFLARHPHKLDLTNYGSCQACEDLVEVFDR